jgi:hypothetical protein
VLPGGAKHIKIDLLHNPYLSHRVLDLPIEEGCRGGGENRAGEDAEVIVKSAQVV